MTGNPLRQICGMGRIIHAQVPRGFGQVRQEFFYLKVLHAKQLKLDLLLADKHTVRSGLQGASYW